MKRASLQSIQSAVHANLRKPGYYEACLKVGKPIRNGTWLEFSDEDHAALRKEFGDRMPPLKTMVKNAAGAAGRVARAALKRERVYVAPEVMEARLAICRACEHLDQARMRCGKCGCFVEKAVIGKTRLATERCPVGKW